MALYTVVVSTCYIEISVAAKKYKNKKKLTKYHGKYRSETDRVDSWEMGRQTNHNLNWNLGS